MTPAVGVGMFHLVARTSGHRRAFSAWQEGVRLWHTVVQATPGLVACCLMPDHVHVISPRDERARLGVALGGYTRWRNARRGEGGTLWQPLPPAEVLADEQKVRRAVRYVHLNPCRGGLVQDPLAWPLSTHLDAVGLVERPACRRRRDPHAFHAYVSGDPSVSISGSDLPSCSGVALSAGAVLHAVSVVTRAPMATVRSKGEERRLALRAMRTLTDASVGEIAALAGVGRATAYRAAPGMDATCRMIERWAADPRCTPLDDGVLEHLVGRSPYRRLRR